MFEVQHASHCKPEPRDKTQQHMRSTASPALWLARTAHAYPRHIALITEQECLDFDTLYTRVAAYATRLMADGLRPGIPTAVISAQARHVAWTTYLSWYLGCPLLPLDPQRGGRDRLWADCGIAQALVGEDGDFTCPTDVPSVSCRALDEPAERALEPTHPLCADAIQLFIATSGTSGEIRAVMLTGKNLAAAVAASRQRLRLGPGDIWLVCLPLVHIGGLSVLFRCAQAGATVLLHEGFDVTRIWNDLRRYSVTHVSLVPAMLARLLEHSEDTPPPQTLRTVLVGGAALSKRLAHRARYADWPICITYGLSETASQVATLCRAPDDWRVGDVGKPLAGIHVNIVDELGNPISGPGRISISGTMVMAGYANFQGKHGLGLNGGRLITNDCGYVDSRGHLHVLGRMDDVMLSGGENIHPQELEARLSNCPGVDDVAVVGIPDETWGQLIVALIHGAADESSLRLWCTRHLPSAQRPRRFVKVGRLPRNELGKLDRARLPALIK